MGDINKRLRDLREKITNLNKYIKTSSTKLYEHRIYIKFADDNKQLLKWDTDFTFKENWQQAETAIHNESLKISGLYLSLPLAKHEDLEVRIFIAQNMANAALRGLGSLTKYPENVEVRLEPLEKAVEALVNNINAALEREQKLQAQKPEQETKQQLLKQQEQQKREKQAAEAKQAEQQLLQQQEQQKRDKQAAEAKQQMEAAAKLQQQQEQMLLQKEQERILLQQQQQQQQQQQEQQLEAAKLQQQQARQLQLDSLDKMKRETMEKLLQSQQNIVGLTEQMSNIQSPAAAADKWNKQAQTEQERLNQLQQLQSQQQGSANNNATATQLQQPLQPQQQQQQQQQQNNTVTATPIAANDASSIAQTIGANILKLRIDNIVNAYNKNFLKTRSSYRFKQRRRTQLNMLSRATVLNDPAAIMAVILAVHKSLEQEGFPTGKWHLHGKSKLKEFLDVDFSGTENLKQFDTVEKAKGNSEWGNDRVKTLNYTTWNTNNKDEAEIKRILDGVLRDAKPRVVKKSWFGFFNKK